MSTNVFLENGTYDVKSCSALEKPFYRPIEAAIRWCNLTAHEAKILEVVGDELLPKLTDFPQWPCLRVNVEKIIYATKNQELRHGRDGRNVLPDDHVAAHRVTVNHADLKNWMQEYFPDQKPAFLFDDIERNLHKSVTVETATALKAEIDALKARLQKAEGCYRELNNEKKELTQKLYAYESRETTDEDSITTLQAIGIMAELLALEDGCYKYRKGESNVNAAAIGMAVSSRAKIRFGDNIRGFDSFNKKISEGLKALEKLEKK